MGVADQSAFLNAVMGIFNAKCVSIVAPEHSKEDQWSPFAAAVSGIRKLSSIAMSVT